MKPILHVVAVLCLSIASLLNTTARADAAEPLPVVASFSILGDMVRQIGGERVAVDTLVGPDADAHVFRPTPRHAKSMAKAKIVFVNGLGFEGWIQRLIEASGFDGLLVVAAGKVKALSADHDVHHIGHGHQERKHISAPDPHAWHDLGNGKIYAANIAAGLSKADPAGKRHYEANLARYLSAIAALEQGFRERLKRLPPGPHRVVTVHHAFAYFEHAYGVEFLAPHGVSTEAEASARDIAHLIRQIRSETVTAVFLENIADPRLIEQIQRETSARIGGTLYSGALSGPDGPAPTYLAMMRHNIRTLLAALGGG